MTRPGLAARSARRGPPRFSSSQKRGRAAVLPDDGVVDGLRRSGGPRRTVVSRWLVMPMAAMSAASTPAWASACRATSSWAGPDLLRVVLDPAGLGKDLAELLLRHGANAAARIEENGAGTGGALVEGQDETHAVNDAVKTPRVQSYWMRIGTPAGLSNGRLAGTRVWSNAHSHYIRGLAP